MTSHTLRRTASLLLLFALCLGTLPGDDYAVVTASAKAGKQQRDKAGSDLRRKLKESAGDDFVKVIVTPNGQWGGALDSDLKGRGAVVRQALKNFPMRAVEMRAKDVEAAAARGDVAYVSLDREVKQLGHLSLTTGADGARAAGSPAYDGAGVGIVFMDSGIDANHASLKDASGGTRVVYSRDFTGERGGGGQTQTGDPYGHGTHVAAMAAGNGKVAGGAYLGIAPNARLINLRVLDSHGRGTISGLLSALDWVMTNRTNPAYNIRVVNLSLGTAVVDSYKNDPLCLAVRRLVDAGVVVVAAAGNEGKDGAGNKIYGQIHSPGIDPSVITVGASNTFGTDVRADDEVASFSSRGPTRSYWTDTSGVKHYDNLVKPDLVAPGNKIISAESKDNYLLAVNPALDAEVSDNASREQMFLSGTSMATPVVSGAAALVLQANPRLTPNLVKMILMYTAQPLANFNNFEQGAGQVNVEGAMRLAKLVRTDLTPTTPVGAPLLLTSTPPPAQTTIAGQTFSWAQGVIMDHTFATGDNLILKYQAVYGLGTLLSDGAVESGSVLTSDGTVMSDGITLSESILTSSGVTLSEGGVFMGTSVLMNDGVMLADRSPLLGDGTLQGDSVLLADGALAGDVAAQAKRALVYGDNTGYMQVVMDGNLNRLTASAVSKTQINLSWREGTNNEVGFRVERSKKDDDDFRQIATVGANATSFSDSGLKANTTYYYRVYAYGNKGVSRYSNTASATTPKK